jgi:hypothetical protein
VAPSCLLEAGSIICWKQSIPSLHLAKNKKVSHPTTVSGHAEENEEQERDRERERPPLFGSSEECRRKKSSQSEWIYCWLVQFATRQAASSLGPSSLGPSSLGPSSLGPSSLGPI